MFAKLTSFICYDERLFPGRKVLCGVGRKMGERWDDDDIFTI